MADCIQYYLVSKRDNSDGIFYFVVTEDQVNLGYTVNWINCDSYLHPSQIYLMP